jgi:hypothetical protein
MNTGILLVFNLERQESYKWIGKGMRNMSSATS